MTTAKRAHELLRYNPESGVLTWRINRRGPVRAGDVAGTRMPNGYMKVGIDGREYLCHRLAWLLVHGNWPKHQLDHINGDPMDNRLMNLREATMAENSQNKTLHARNTSGYPGVTWNSSRGKWVAQLTVAGRHKTIGYFNDAVEADAARRHAKAALHPFAPVSREVA